LLVEYGLKLPVHPTELFNVVIQCGAVLAVLLAFSQRLQQMWLNRATPQVRDYVLKLVIAFMVTAVGGLLLKRLGWKLSEENPIPVAWATLIGGLVILAVEWLKRDKAATGTNEISWTVALAVGLSQVIAAAFPGTSRSGACIAHGNGAGDRTPRRHRVFLPRGCSHLARSRRFIQFLSALKHPQLWNPSDKSSSPQPLPPSRRSSPCVGSLNMFNPIPLSPSVGYRIVLGVAILLALRRA
jgi:undecaprenyl pyrophosphate phosphatase UppP